MAEAERRRIVIDADSWQQVRKALRVEAFRVGRSSGWKLVTFEDDFAAWLATPAGRFAAYCAHPGRQTR